MSGKMPSSLIAPHLSLTTFLHVPNSVGDLVKRRVPEDLVVGWLKKCAHVIGAAGHNGMAGNYPKRHAFAAAGIQVARILQGHFLIVGMQVAAMHKGLTRF